LGTVLLASDAAAKESTALTASIAVALLVLSVLLWLLVASLAATATQMTRAMVVLWLVTRATDWVLGRLGRPGVLHVLFWLQDKASFMVATRQTRGGQRDRIGTIGNGAEGERTLHDRHQIFQINLSMYSPLSLSIYLFIA
jgi:hypothetical protein